MSPPRVGPRSRSRTSWTTRPPTSSYAASGHRSPCWVRSSPDVARPASPCPVATRSGPAAWTCTSAGCRSSGPSYASSTGRSSPRCPSGLRRGQPVAGLPLGRGHREPGDGGRAGQGHHRDRQRRPGAGDRRPVPDARRDGCPDRRGLHVHPGDRGRRASCGPSSTGPSRTGSWPAPGSSRPRSRGASCTSRVGSPTTSTSCSTSSSRQAPRSSRPTTGFTVRTHRRLTSFDVATLPYPGFPTDLQPFAMALAAVSEGTAMITENVFEARFMFAQELARLGADLRTDGHHAVVRGVPMLSGAPVVAHDIRAGAALVLGGLAAQGTTEVAESQHIDRGYPMVRGGAGCRRRRCVSASRSSPSYRLFAQKVRTNGHLRVHVCESRYAKSVVRLDIGYADHWRRSDGANDRRAGRSNSRARSTCAASPSCARPSTPCWTSATVTSTWTSAGSSRST